MIEYSVLHTVASLCQMLRLFDLSPNNLLGFIILNEFQMLLCAGLFLILLIHQFFKNKNLSKSLKNQKAFSKRKEMEILQLKTQLNPHFIFNSLNAIQDLIFANDQKSANKYLVKFTRLLREAFENSELEMSSLNSELRLLHTYLDLQYLRFENKFSLDMKVDPKINKEKVFIPRGILRQIIAFNIWYGLKNCSKSTQLIVSVLADKGFIIFEIRNNSLQINDYQKPDLEASIIQIENQYQHKLKIKWPQVFTVRSNGNGSTMKLKLPSG